VLELGLYYDFVYPQDQAAVLAALGDAGIPVLLLKGYAIAEGIYGERILRPYSDIDLLVQPEQLDHAAHILESIGYYPDEGQHNRQWYLDQHHHMVPYVRAGTLPVEVHRALVGSTCAVKIDHLALWSQAVPLNVGGYDTQTLCDTHLLLHLCMHMTCTHVFEMGLKPLCDVRELVNRRPPDWNAVLATAAAWRCTRHVGLVMAVVSQLFRLPQPPHLPQPEARFLDYVLANIMATAVAGLPESSGLAEIWHEPGMPARIRRIMGRLFPDRTEVAAAFHLSPNDPRIWLYYPRWQAQLVRHHGTNAWQLLRGNTKLQQQAQAELTRRALLEWLQT
jgi:hypothetical protein